MNTQALNAARQSILLGNNGYADIGTNAEIAEALRAEGFTVLTGKTATGWHTFIGYTKRGQDALQAEWRDNGIAGYARTTYQRPEDRLDGRNGMNEHDYEGAILARQEQQNLYE